MDLTKSATELERIKPRQKTVNISTRGYFTRGVPPPLRAKRNDPCPCESGKKYKKCCMPLDQGFGHDDDGRLVPARVLEHQMQQRLAQQRVRDSLGNYEKGTAIER